jgi:transposase
MDVVFTHCAGVDVHKKTVMACRVTPDPTGQQPDGIMELQEFGTMTRDLLALADWLAAVGITHVAMESTGEYWRPVSNLLEGDFTVFLVNAAHVKQGPGRKTDTADARWLAKLMRYGLLQASFIPPQGQRDLRELTRYRTKLVQERSREVNRVQGVLERANIKLAAVATDIMGVSGRAILAALIQGRADPATMAELAKGRMRTKIPLLEQALAGRMREHHRRLRTLQLAHIDFLDEQIAALGAESTDYLRALEPGDPLAPPTESPGAAGEAERAAAPDVPGPRSPLCVRSRCWTLSPGSTSGAQSCWWPSGGLTCGAVARPVGCRPGPAWPRATTRARGSGARGRRAKGIMSCGQV